MFLLGDYIACCDEEEELLRNDIPLTLEHKSKLLQDAGFIIAKVLDDPDGVTIITAGKGD